METVVNEFCSSDLLDTVKLFLGDFTLALMLLLFFEVSLFVSNRRWVLKINETIGRWFVNKYTSYESYVIILYYEKSNIA